MKRLMLMIFSIGFVGCMPPAYTSTQDSVLYFQNAGLCFAKISWAGDFHFINVPCSAEVLNQISQQPPR